MLKEKLRRGIVPKWACPEQRLKNMPVRMALELNRFSPTQRA